MNPLIGAVFAEQKEEEKSLFYGNYQKRGPYYNLYKVHIYTYINKANKQKYIETTIVYLLIIRRKETDSLLYLNNSNTI